MNGVSVQLIQDTCFQPEMSVSIKKFDTAPGTQFSFPLAVLSLQFSLVLTFLLLALRFYWLYIMLWIEVYIVIMLFSIVLTYIF